MKRFCLTSIMLFTAALFLFSCSPKKEAKPKSLVLYYSQTSNTKGVAEHFQALLNADIEAIEAVEPYSGTYQETIERGRKEREEGVLPEIKPLSHNVAEYDIIFIGYPVWFGTYAPPIATLLNQIDLSGKKVVPFCTFGSGGLQSSSKDIVKNEPNAEVLPGYGVRAARLASAAKEVEQFLIAGGFIEGEAVKLPEFSPMAEATEEEVAILNEAIKDYPMMSAVNVESVAKRAVAGGTEYLFIAKPLPRQAPPMQPKDAPKPPKDMKPRQDAPPQPSSMQIYVLHPDGGKAEFTQVVR